MSLSCQPTLSVSGRSISPICDHGGPSQSPKASRDTPKTTEFSFVHALRASRSHLSKGLKSSKTYNAIVWTSPWKQISEASSNRTYQNILTFGFCLKRSDICQLSRPESVPICDEFGRGRYEFGRGRWCCLRDISWLKPRQIFVKQSPKVSSQVHDTHESEVLSLDEASSSTSGQRCGTAFLTELESILSSLGVRLLRVLM